MIRCLILAIGPGIFLLIYIKALNPFESKGMGMFRFLLAGLASVILAALAEDFLGTVWLEYCAGNPALYDFIDNFLITAVTEEGLKLIMFVIAISAYAKSVNSYDETTELGIITCCFYTGMGFAIAENILYALDGDVWVMFFRMIFCLLGHGVYAVFMGDYYFALIKSKKLYYAALMLLVPVILHGMYDFCIGSENDYLILFTVIFEIYLYVIGYKKLCVLSAHSFNEYFIYN